MASAPESSVVIEDSPAGVQAAVAAGMRVLGYSSAGDEKGLAALGAEVFDNMADVPRLLGLEAP
jgi:beta-phosphoglucomutase-like phosphatase (HAD superfamily)